MVIGARGVRGGFAQPRLEGIQAAQHATILGGELDEEPQAPEARAGWPPTAREVHADRDAEEG
jgi:hypothetical protein